MSQEIQDGMVEERGVLDVLDPITQIRVPFPTRSDALLAELILKHGISRRQFDITLSILNDRSFSLQEVTLQNSFDIDRHISEHRFSLAQRRSDCGVYHPPSDPSRPQSTRPNATTSIVYNLVLEHMLTSLPHFSHEADTPRFLGEGVDPNHDIHASLIHDLCSLSLVHRSWTSPAQRALARRVVLPSRRRLRAFARSPACSEDAGVREFVYKVDRADTAALLNDRLVAREHWSLLASVLKRLKNVRLLCLRIERAHPADLAGLEQVVQVLEGLVSLEGLWLLSVRDHCPYLPGTCAILSKLVNLRFLSLFNWTCPNESQDREPLLHEHPPARLKALQLRDSYLVTPPAYLSWLFAPLGDHDYSLHTLDLQITFAHLRDPTNVHGGDITNNNTMLPPTQPDQFLTALDPLLDTLTDLAVRLFYMETPIRPGNAFARARTSILYAIHDLDLQQILTRSKALRRVRLHRLPTITSPNTLDSTSTDSIRIARLAGTPPIPFALPTSLEELHMHYTYAGVNWRTQDKRLASALSSMTPTTCTCTPSTATVSFLPQPPPPPQDVPAITWKGPETSKAKDTVSPLPGSSLRRVLVSAGEFDMPSRANVVSDVISDVCRMPRTATVCAALGVELVPMDGVYLNQYVVDLLR